MATRTYTAELTVVACCSCDLMFGMPTPMYDRMRDTHKTWYCPAGHAQHFTGKSEKEKATERAEWYRQQLASRDEDVRAEKVAHAVTKGKLTKARNRADKGICQHCRRSFVNVKRHVEHMHPEATSA